jgi:hypothetical protein
MTQLGRDRLFEITRVRRWWVLLLVLSTMTGLSRPAGLSAQDGSVGWTAPEDISAPFSAGRDLYGTMRCDANQNLHILWGKSRMEGSEIYYRTDAQGTLSPPIDVIAVPDTLAIRLSAAITDRDGILHLIWQNDHTGGRVYYSRVPLAAADNSREWDMPVVVLPYANSASIGTDHTGELLMVYTTSDIRGFGNTVYMMRTKDSGLTWEEAQMIYEAVEEVPSSVSAGWGFDGAGRLHLGITIRSWIYGDYSELGYLRSPDGGTTWEPYRAIAIQSETTPNVASIVPFIFGEDEIHLTWHDPRRLHIWSEDGGATWTTPIEIVRLGAGFGGANFLTKDGAGVLRAVTSVANGVYVSTFSGSEWLPPEQIENRSMDPHGQVMVVCQGNHLHIIYDDRVVEDTTVWYVHRVVNAPHIARGPVPTGETMQEDAEVLPIAPQPTSTPAETPTPPPPLPSSDIVPPVSSGGAVLPLVLSVIPVIVITTAVWVSRKYRGR